MTINNTKEMQMFEKVIDRCKKTVWLVTPEGEQFDLKTLMGRSAGIKKMLNAKDYEEPELFTSCIEDEMTFFEFFSQCRQSA